MAKDIATELIDALSAYKDQEMKRVAQALEAGETPPVVLTPTAVMKKVYEVARHHKMTPDELDTVMMISYAVTAQTGDAAPDPTIQKDYREKLERED